jgi:hypothetical protein
MMIFSLIIGFQSVMPGRLEEANPEARDSQVRNCAP